MGRVIQAIDPLGRETDYTYASNLIDLVQVKQKNGSGYDILASYTYNSSHLPLTAVDAAGQTTTFTYNAAGQILTITNPKGEVMTYGYNGSGYLTSVTGPVAGATTSYTYDSFGHVATVTDSEGYTVSMTYDAFDRPTQVTFPDGTNQQIIYNRLDPEWTSDRSGRWSRQIHDALRHVVIQQDPLGRRTVYTWCLCGSLVGLTDPAGNKTSWNRDVEGRITGKVFPDGSTQTYAYETTTSRLKSFTDLKSQVTN